MIEPELAKIYREISDSGILINVVTNVQELREFMDKYRGVVSPTPIVLSDISTLGRNQSRLLKFVEESSSPILCIASRDNVSRILLSRFRTIHKKPDIQSTDGDNPSFLREKLIQGKGEISIYDIVKSAPSVFPVVQQVGLAKLPVKNKILQILFG